MSAVSYDRLPRKQGLRFALPLGRFVRETWGRARSVLLIALPIVFAALAIWLAVLGIRTDALSRQVAALRAGDNIEVGVNARPELLSARIQYLLRHERVDDVQPYVEALDRSTSEQARAIAHYNFGNGRLRQAFDELSASRPDKAGPFVVLARQEYRRALTLDPEMWDAKFNLDVASRLVRDFPAFERTMGDEVKAKKKLWTDVPGKPEGLP